MATATRERSPRIGVSKLEAAILNLVWGGKKTVREVHETMLEDGYTPYTTVMACMNNMAQKGLLKQSKRGKAYTYRPAAKKEDFIDSLIKEIEEIFS